MARDNIAFLVNLRKNENTESKGYGCYYCEAEKKEPMNLKGFARHLAEHGKLASYEMLVLVLQNVVDCMTHLVATGQPVKLDGLGTFYPTIEGKPATSVEKGVEQMNENIVGVHLRFRPEGAKGEDLTSRMLKEKCTFQPYQLIKTKYKVIDGKRKAYQERTPLDTYAVAHYEPEP
jgi:nucleoid DNA-binding protein